MILKKDNITNKNIECFIPKCNNLIQIKSNNEIFDIDLKNIKHIEEKDKYDIMTNYLFKINKALNELKNSNENINNSNVLITIECEELFNIIKPNDLIISKPSNSFKKSVSNTDFKRTLGITLYEFSTFETIDLLLRKELLTERNDNMINNHNDDINFNLDDDNTNFDLDMDISSFSDMINVSNKDEMSYEDDLFKDFDLNTDDLFKDTVNNDDFVLDFDSKEEVIKDNVSDNNSKISIPEANYNDFKLEEPTTNIENTKITLDDDDFSFDTDFISIDDSNDMDTAIEDFNPITESNIPTYKVKKESDVNAYNSKDDEFIPVYDSKEEITPVYESKEEIIPVYESKEESIPVYESKEEITPVYESKEEIILDDNSDDDFLDLTSIEVDKPIFSENKIITEISTNTDNSIEEDKKVIDEPKVTNIEESTSNKIESKKKENTPNKINNEKHEGRTSIIKKDNVELNKKEIKENVKGGNTMNNNTNSNKNKNSKDFVKHEVTELRNILKNKSNSYSNKIKQLNVTFEEKHAALKDLNLRDEEELLKIFKEFLECKSNMVDLTELNETCNSIIKDIDDKISKL